MHHPASSAMPYFEGVAARMRAGGAGTEFYSEPDGNSWLAAYRQVRGLKLSLAAAENYTAASADVRRAGLSGLALAAAAGLAAVTLLLLTCAAPPRASNAWRTRVVESRAATSTTAHRDRKGGDEMSRSKRASI